MTEINPDWKRLNDRKFEANMTWINANGIVGVIDELIDEHPELTIADLRVILRERERIAAHELADAVDAFEAFEKGRER